MNRYFYVLIILAVAIGNVSAGTVTLTGTCNIPVHNNLTFKLANTGNDSASNLVLTPHIQNVQLSQSQYTAQSILENSTENFTVSFSNVTIPGSYSDYFVLAYLQGSDQPFTALFPCTVDLYNSTTSEVFVTSNVISKTLDRIINVSLFNEGAENLSVNVSLLLPPTLGSDSNIVVNMAPYQHRSLNFSVQNPQSGASYLAMVSAQYEFSGMHYASQSIFAISGSVASTTSFSISPYLPFLAIIVVILVVIALIVLGLRRSRSKHQGV